MFDCLFFSFLEKETESDNIIIDDTCINNIDTMNDTIIYCEDQEMDDYIISGERC